MVFDLKDPLPLELTEEITKCIYSKQRATGVFLELKRAFDTICHNTLVEKLPKYGISGIVCAWVTSYLQDRTQFV